LVYASLFLIPPSSATNISPLSLHDALPIYKAYLFADPFTRPVSFSNGEYKVFDPSFDNRPTVELVKEFGWMRERVLQIRLALLRSEEHTSELQSRVDLVCRLLLEKKKKSKQ